MQQKTAELTLAASLLALVGFGCVSHDQPTGCTSNEDCRGDRVCHAGACRFASAVPDASSTEDTDDGNRPNDAVAPPDEPDAGGNPPPPDSSPNTELGEPEPPSPDAGGEPDPVDAAPPPPEDGGGGPPDATASCRDILYCSAIVCGEDDESCLQTQVQQGTPEGRSQAQDYFECVEANNCSSTDDPDACREENCGEAQEACIAIPEEGDGLSCSGVLRCLNECERGARECPRDCFRRGTQEAQQGMREFIECSREECSRGAGETCLRDSCGDEVENCFGCANL